MKNFFRFLLALLFAWGCSSDEESTSGDSKKLTMEYPEALAGIIAGAVDADKLDDTQPKDNFIARTQYVPNELTPGSGWVKRIYQGKITILVQIKEGNLNGKCIVFELGGTKDKEFTLKEGINDGPYVRFLPDGKKKFECMYVNGKENGMWKSWHDNGLLAEERTYVNGKAEGPFARYHDNANKAMTGSYKAGKLDGPFEKWFSGKMKEASGIYKAGALDGPYFEFHSNGRKSGRRTTRMGSLMDPMSVGSTLIGNSRMGPMQMESGSVNG